MEPLALTESELAYLKEQRDREVVSRNVLSGLLEAQLKTLFPNAPDTFFQANAYFANELARGAGEIADAVSAANINWTGTSDDAGVEQMFTKELVRLMAVDGLVSGKLALFPRVDEEGRFVLEALNGYLHPVLSSGNALRVDALLQILTVTVNDETRYEVRVYRPGMLEVYPAVQELAEYDKSAPEAYPQPHSPDALPVAFRIIRRDAHRRAVGLVAESLNAFMRYAKTAINRNAVQENAGWPERVVKSDDYLSMIRQGDPMKPGQEHPAVTSLKTVGPRQLKVLGTNDNYEVQDGVDPQPHMDAETADKQALLDVLRSPDLSGQNLSGVALAERQSKSRALIVDICNYIADLVTETLTIADGLPQANVGTGIKASLTPRFATDRNARVQEITLLYQAGALPKSVLYQELQTLGYESITDELIETTIAQEATDTDPYTEPRGVTGADTAPTRGNSSAARA